MYPGTKLEKIYRNIKISSTLQSRIHNVWHTVKDYEICKEAGKHSPYENNLKQPKLTQMLEVAEDITAVILTISYIQKVK